MSSSQLRVGVAVCLLVASRVIAAGDGLPMAVDANLANVQPAYAQLAVAPQPSVVQTQYVPPEPAMPGPILAPQPVDVPYVIAEPAPCCEVCGSSGGCSCDDGCYRSGWTFGFELYGLRSHVTDSQFGRWTDDAGGAARFTLGYEWADGFGVRAIAWGYSDEERPPAGDVELSLGTIHLDMYKAIVTRRGELLLGGGPAIGNVEFWLPALRDRSEFNGAGGSIFVSGYAPFLERKRWEVGVIGETRVSLLVGDWEDDTGFVIPPTDGDTMSVLELAFGVEVRRRFGRLGDHYWFFRVMPEFQQWSSAWMDEFIDSSIGLAGTNFSLGVTW
jgi:hypothetical protein